MTLPVILGRARRRRSPLLNGLVSYWSLNEASGTRLDRHGTNHLTDNNTVGQAAGKVGQAAQFVAANSEYLSISDNASLRAGNTSFTIAAWVWADSYPNGSNTRIVAKNNGPTNMCYDLSFGSFTISDASGTNAAVNNNWVQTAGIWRYIIAWRDRDAGSINSQINNGTVTTTNTAVIPNTSNATFMIGNTQVAGRYWDGRLDEVVFWRRVLTATERTWLYNSGNGRSYNDLLRYRG